MIEILLAVALSVVVVPLLLLNRRMARLNRRVSRLERERNEHFLREREKMAWFIDMPVNGTGIPQLPEPAGLPEPVRRKGHLSLYVGSGVSAVLGGAWAVLRQLWQSHRYLSTAAAASTAGLIAAAATSAFLISERPHTEPPAADPVPTATAQVTVDPDNTDGAASPEPALGSSRTAPEGSPSPTALPSGSPSMPSGNAAQEAAPARTDRGRSTAEAAPPGLVADQPQRDHGNDEGANATQGKDIGSGNSGGDGDDKPRQPADEPLLCLDVTVQPVADAEACLTG